MTMMIVRMFKVMPPPFDRGDVEEEYAEIFEDFPPLDS